MATIVTKNGRIEIPDTDPRVQAHRALQIAAERIGRGNYQAGLYRVQRIRGQVVRGYTITQAHEDIIEAMPMVLDGRMSPDTAMNLLQRGDVQDQRLRSNS